MWIRAPSSSASAQSRAIIGDAEPGADRALVHRAAGRQRRILLVQGEHPAAQQLVAHRAAQDPGADHGLAVVGEAQRALAAQLGHLGELLAAQPAGDRGHEAQRHAGLALGLLAQGAQLRRVVEHRIGVGHRHHGDETAGRRGAGAGVEVLLVLLAGRAQVDVRVDEARQQVAALAVDHLGARRGLERAGRAELGDLAAAHEHVGGAVVALARVEDVGAADQQVGGRRGDGDERLPHASAPLGSGSGARTPASSS
jgi:hypothetical protein